MARYFIPIGAAFALLAVVSGAFGAHLLKGLYSTEQLAWHEKAVYYQTTHALGLIILGVLHTRFQNRSLINLCGVLFILGILLFSGSLYLLALLELRWLGMLTPFGGMAFILAWLILIILAWPASRRTAD